MSSARGLKPLLGYLTLSAASSGIQLLLLPLHLRYIPSDQYGVLAAALLIATVVAIVANLRLDAAMRTFYFDHWQDQSRIDAYLSQLFTVSLWAMGAVLLVMAFVGDAVVDWVYVRAMPKYRTVGMLALATAAIHSCLSIYFVYLRNGLRVAELVCWQGGITLGTAVLQVALVAGLGLGIRGILLGSLMPAAGALLVLLWRRPDLVVWRLRRDALEPALRYALPLVGLGLLYVLGTRLDRVIIERGTDLGTFGAYAVLAGLFSLLTIVLNALDNAIRPYLYPEMRSGAASAEVLPPYQTLYIVAGCGALSVAVLLGASMSLVTDDPDYLAVRAWLAPAAVAYMPGILARYYTLFCESEKKSTLLAAGVTVRFVVLLLVLLWTVPGFGIGGALFAIFVADLVNAVVIRQRTRSELAAGAPLAPAALQAGVLLGGLVLAYFAVGAESGVAFGVIQFAVVLGLLVLTTRREVGRLLGRLTRHGGVP